MRTLWVALQSQDRHLQGLMTDCQRTKVYQTQTVWESCTSYRARAKAARRGRWSGSTIEGCQSQSLCGLGTTCKSWAEISNSKSLKRHSASVRAKPFKCHQRTWMSSANKKQREGLFWIVRSRTERSQNLANRPIKTWIPSSRWSGKLTRPVRPLYSTWSRVFQNRSTRLATSSATWPPCLVRVELRPRRQIQTYPSSISSLLHATLCSSIRGSTSGTTISSFLTRARRLSEAGHGPRLMARGRLLQTTLGKGTTRHNPFGMQLIMSGRYIVANNHLAWLLSRGAQIL